MALTTVDVFHDVQADPALDGVTPATAIKAAQYNAKHKVDLATLATALGIRVSAGDPNGTVTGTIGDLARDTVGGQLYINTTGAAVWVAFARADGGAVPPATMALWLGDSHVVGQGNLGGIDATRLTELPNPLITESGRRAAGAGIDPIQWSDLAAGPLRLYSAVDPTLGSEISFALAAFRGGINVMIDVDGISGTSLGQWGPQSTFPTQPPGGPNLLGQTLARANAIAAANSRRVGCVCVSCGGNDAGSTPDTTAFQARMAATCNAIWATCGQQVIICWLLTHINTAVDPGNLATVRAAQIAVAATDPRIRLVRIDDLELLLDNIHLRTQSHWTYGERCAVAWLDSAGYGRQRVTTIAPAVVGRGEPSFGNGGTRTPRSWPGTQALDREYLIVSRGLVNTPIPAPGGGWTLVPNTAISNSSFAFLSVYERAITAAMFDPITGLLPATTIVDGALADNFAQIVCVRSRIIPGVAPTTPTTEASMGTAGTVVDVGPFAMTGVTALGADRLILMIDQGYGQLLDNTTTLTAAGLANVTKVYDGTQLTPATNKWNNSLHTGITTASGAIANPSITMLGNHLPMMAVIAVKA